MTNLFVPYSGKKPASVEINGHSLIIITTDKDTLENGLDVLGGDRVKALPAKQTTSAQEKVIGKLAKSIQGGVVIAPGDVAVETLIDNLKAELPWLH